MSPKPTRRSHRLLPLAALTLWLTGLVAAPSTASACGGCFQPASGVTSPVVQSGERVLFVRDTVNNSVLAWIEVRYSGPASSFAWVIPLPKVPKVSVGTSYIFNRLDLATAPRFRVDQLGTLENCHERPSGASSGNSDPQPVSRDVGSGCGGGGSFSSGYGTTFSASGSGGDTSQGRSAADKRRDFGVDIVHHDQVGPYDWVLIQGDKASDVQTWLSTNGYAVPASSVPIIEAHVAKGDVFLAVKLAAGASASEIRPIVLEMKDAEACVPLRLTSIAATNNLNVVAYIAGPGRAVPKNHMHVVVNPTRLNLLAGASNYQQVLAAALDEASGRAFATEFSGAYGDIEIQPDYGFERALRRDAMHDVGAPIEPKRLDTAPFRDVHDGDDLVATLAKTRFPVTHDTVSVFERHADLAELDWSSGSSLNSKVRAYSRLVDGSAQVPESALRSKFVNGPALAAELRASFAAPLLHLHQALGSTRRLTRLSMLISPDEMTRDPIFAFNPSLPKVDSMHTVTTRRVCPDGWMPPTQRRVTLASDALSGSWIVDGQPQFDERFALAPAAMKIEVLDETGPAKAIASAQIELVDTALGAAVVGAPSLSPALALSDAGDNWQPPPDDPTATALASWSAGVPSRGAWRWLVGLLFGFGVLLLRRQFGRL